MVVDFHTHCFPNKIAAKAIDKLSRMSGSVAFTDGTLDMLVESMRKYGVNRSVLLPVATEPAQVEHINDFAVLISEQYAEHGILSFGAIHPDYADYKRELARAVHNGIKGIKIHPVYQGTDITDIKFLRILDRAAELNLTVVLHAGHDIGFPGAVHCSPAMLRSALDAVGSFRAVLAHMGGWREWDEAIKYLADTAAYIDTAFSFGKITPVSTAGHDDDDWNLLGEKDFRRFLDAFGADRILFGTDSPWSSQGESLGFIQKLSIDEADKKKILGENAVKILAD